MTHPIEKELNKMKISDIVDTNGDEINESEITRFIGIDELYEYCDILGRASECEFLDMKDRSNLATLNSRIRIAYFYKILQSGGRLDPISLKDNILVDGFHRLQAHILNKETEIEYTWYKEGT